MDNTHTNRIRFAFVVATPKEEGTTLPIHQTLAWMNTAPFGVEVEVFVQAGNKEGLPKVYNRFIDVERKKPTHDFVVFLHDDLWLTDCLFFKKVMEVCRYNGYDIIGACGGGKWTLQDPTKPNIWTKAAQGSFASGFMIHAAKPEFTHATQTYDGRSLFASNYGYSPAKTLTLDGSILCVSKKAIEKGARFDEQFDWHFYDMDFCVNAVKTLGLVVGTAPFIATHESLGESVTSRGFYDAQARFVKKWFDIDIHYTEEGGSTNG